MRRADYYYGRACDAWRRKCERLGTVPDEPSRELSTVQVGSFVIVRLRSQNGLLGTYRYLLARPTGLILTD